MNKLFYLFCLVVCISCAKIPMQSISLMQQIKNEGERMHKLNLAYVNKLFNDQSEAINLFIEKEYTPEYIREIKAEIKNKEDELSIKIDMNKEWPNIVPKINKRVNAVKDSLVKVITLSQQLIVNKLNEDYQVYEQACETQLNLLTSAAKLNESGRQAANSILSKITNNKVNMNSLESTLNNYLQKGSNAGQMITSFQLAISNLLTNK